MDMPSSHSRTDSHCQPYWEAQAVRTQIVSALDHRPACIFSCSRLHVKSRALLLNHVLRTYGYIFFWALGEGYSSAFSAILCNTVKTEGGTFPKVHQSGTLTTVLITICEAIFLLSRNTTCFCFPWKHGSCFLFVKRNDIARKRSVKNSQYFLV